jgi:hypothetical protein
MAPVYAFTIGLIHHLLSLSSNFLELRSTSQDTSSTIFNPIVLPNQCFANMSYCEIPVKMPKSETQCMTIVSPSDYDHLVSIAPTWRVSNRGYVISSKRMDGRYRLVYMHKIVAGAPAKHLNGDRLDNRRDNLIPSKPRRPFIELSPLDLDTAHPLMDFSKTAEQCLQFRSTGKYNTIHYSGNKIYSGETHNELPHGLGTLTESNRTSFGWFLYGQFKSGCVLDHPVVCDRLQYLYTSPYKRPITDAFVVLPNGKHQRLN